MANKKHRSAVSSTVNLKCPKCREGNLFKTPTFGFNDPFSMPDNCEVCNQPFMLEPGFYYGAMFISYIFMGFFCIFFTGTLHWGFGIGTVPTFIALIAVCIFFFVYIFRIARSMWIHFNVKYDPTAGKEG